MRVWSCPPPVVLRRVMWRWAARLHPVAHSLTYEKVAEEQKKKTTAPSQHPLPHHWLLPHSDHCVL